MRYGVTDKELLAITAALQHFRNMLLGQRIIIYTDHINLTYANTTYSSDRILRQRLIIEEYGAELRYVKGESNVVADTLSRIPITEDDKHTEELF